MEILSKTTYIDHDIVCEGPRAFEIEITVVRLDPEMYNQHLEYTQVLMVNDCETMEEVRATNEYRRVKLQEWKRKLSEALGYDDFPGHIYITDSFAEFFTVVHTKRIK